jgi:anti-anti-sigma factor
MTRAVSTDLCDVTLPTVDVHWPRPDAAVVALGGEHDLDSVPTVETSAGEAALTCSHLIIDLSQVEFVDSSIINALVRLAGELETTGRRFNVVLGTSPNIERTLDICGVLPALNRVTTLEAALEEEPASNRVTTRDAEMDEGISATLGIDPAVGTAAA